MQVTFDGVTDKNANESNYNCHGKILVTVQAVHCICVEFKNLILFFFFFFFFRKSKVSNYFNHIC